MNLEQSQSGDHTDDFSCFYENYWNCRLPVKDSDNSGFLKMGIELGPFAEGDWLRDAKIPDGWRLRPTNGKPKWFDILDDKDRIRAKVCKDESNPKMYPERRYGHYHSESATEVIFFVHDGNVTFNEKKKIIYSVSYSLPDKRQHQAVHNERFAQYKNKEYCIKWLNENLPLWQDSSAYWDKKIEG